MRRLPLDRALEPRQGVVRPAGLAQRDRKQGLDLRVMTSPRDGFERRNSVCDAALHQQGAAQDMQRQKVARTGLEHIADNTFGITRAAAVQSEHGSLQHVVGAARAAGSA